MGSSLVRSAPCLPRRCEEGKSAPYGLRRALADCRVLALIIMLPTICSASQLSIAAPASYERRATVVSHMDAYPFCDSTLQVKGLRSRICMHTNGVSGLQIRHDAWQRSAASALVSRSSTSELQARPCMGSARFLRTPPRKSTRSHIRTQISGLRH